MEKGDTAKVKDWSKQVNLAQVGSFIELRLSVLSIVYKSIDSLLIQHSSWLNCLIIFNVFFSLYIYIYI